MTRGKYICKWHRVFVLIYSVVMTISNEKQAEMNIKICHMSSRYVSNLMIVHPSPAPSGLPSKRNCCQPCVVKPPRVRGTSSPSQKPCPRSLRNIWIFWKLIRMWNHWKEIFEQDLEKKKQRITKIIKNPRFYAFFQLIFSVIVKIHAFKGNLTYDCQLLTFPLVK